MKTLDEVIDLMEGADFIDWGADALHYLKEYKKYTDTMCALPDYYEWVHSADNPPLTWDELRTMEGKPVWVEYESYTPDWEVIENVGATRGAVGDFTGNFIETHMSILHKEDQGKTWQAYRKERNVD